MAIVQCNKTGNADSGLADTEQVFFNTPKDIGERVG